MSKYLLLILLGLCSFTSVCAQLNWQSKGPLYEDQYLTVEIEYAMGYNPCDADGMASQYRYKITKLKKQQEFYINWRFDYFTCDHQLKSHANSLLITKKIKIGYITPAENQFSALKLVNNFNDVRRSSRLVEVSAYYPKSPVSLEPKAISGKFVIAQGEATVLTFQGGYLAAHDTWKWYEGDCNGLPVGSGSSLTVSPRQTTTYALRAEGQRVTACLTVTVTVSDANEPPTGITGPSSVCAGEKNSVLAVAGGKLVPGDKWVWYRDRCAGILVGEGARITVSPLGTTSYFVRAEGRGGNTACRMHQLVVTAPSRPADRIAGPENIAYGDPIVLSVQGGELTIGAQWIWYSGRPGQEVRLGEGHTFTVANANSDQIYSVRAEGACFQSAFVVKPVRVSKKTKPEHRSAASREKLQFFINGGLVTNDPNQLSGIKNYVATIGGGRNIGWFLRAKISGVQFTPNYETGGTQITNYSLPGYYQYNGEVISKRTGYTGGLYLGIANLAFYIGGGYGIRELLYGIDQYRYDSSYRTGTAWVKNNAYSYSGAELEGGLILKTGSFNVMGGLSNVQGKYTDYNLGLGFNF
jgi:hypothetical protein